MNNLDTVRNMYNSFWLTFSHFKRISLSLSLTYVVKENSHFSAYLLLVFKLAVLVSLHQKDLYQQCLCTTYISNTGAVFSGTECSFQSLRSRLFRFLSLSVWFDSSTEADGILLMLTHLVTAHRRRSFLKDVFQYRVVHLQEKVAEIIYALQLWFDHNITIHCPFLKPQ